MAPQPGFYARFAESLATKAARVPLHGQFRIPLSQNAAHDFPSEFHKLFEKRQNQFRKICDIAPAQIQFICYAQKR